jgi:hypothetical protein
MCNRLPRGKPVRQSSEPCVVLAEIYNWFTLRFDIAELKDTKALLDDLAL